MLLLEFSMSPMDQGESLSEFVAPSLDIIHKSGVPYRLNPMGTVMEGEWDEVMGVVKACFDKMSESSRRIAVSMKIDYRKGRSGRLESKIRSIEKRLGHDLRQ